MLMNQAAESRREASKSYRAGQFLSDIVLPWCTDVMRETAVEDPPPIWLESEFAGGRERLGPGMDALGRPGVAMSVVLGGPLALRLFLAAVGDTWRYVPRKRTAFLRVTMAQKLLTMRLLPAFVIWLLISLVAALVVVGAAATSDPDFFLGGLGVALLVYLGNNYLLLRSARKLGEGALRWVVTVDYGYPVKSVLLEVSSDGSIGEQLESIRGVMRMFESNPPATWEQLNVNTSATTAAAGMIGRTLARGRRFWPLLPIFVVGYLALSVLPKTYKKVRRFINSAAVSTADSSTTRTLGADSVDDGGVGRASHPAVGSPKPKRSGRADSCLHANDGTCDEPRICAPGTDSTDCGN